MIVYIQYIPEATRRFFYVLYLICMTFLNLFNLFHFTNIGIHILYLLADASLHEAPLKEFNIHSHRLGGWVQCKHFNPWHRGYSKCKWHWAVMTHCTVTSWNTHTGTIREKLYTLMCHRLKSRDCGRDSVSHCCQFFDGTYPRHVRLCHAVWHWRVCTLPLCSITTRGGKWRAKCGGKQSVLSALETSL